MPKKTEVQEVVTDVNEAGNVIGTPNEPFYGNTVSVSEVAPEISPEERERLVARDAALVD